MVLPQREKGQPAMKLNPIGSNVTELELPNGTTILFSYKTPVACNVPGTGFYRTEQHYSSTTSKHINRWLAGANATTKPQAYFDRLFK